MTSDAGYSIVVVDEQPLVFQALTTRIRAQGFAVQATLRTAAGLLEFLDGQPVDVIVLGLPLRTEGLACLRAVRSTFPDIPVLVCNAPGEGEPELAFAEGAAAFVAKSGHPDDIVAAIRQMVSRSIFLSPSERRRVAGTTQSTALTPRELEVVVVAAEGGSNTEIARRLWVTEQTIKFHLSNIYRKLGVSNRTEMSRYAQLHGLLDEQRGAPAARPARRARM